MSASPHDANSMEQVRELLFGSQLKEMETRLQKQEEHIMLELGSLRDELRGSIKKIEDGLSKRLEDEARKRGQDKDDSAEQIAALKAEMESRAAKLADALAKSESALRALVSGENLRIAETVEEQYKSALNSLSENTGQIRRDMVDKGTISALLNELAGKIAGGAGESGEQA